MSILSKDIIDNQVIKEPRTSNLELYRIICMLMIVAHHYVVNSGLNSTGGPMYDFPSEANSIYLALLGAWGKTGINCFLMITGYFMCRSKITLRKFVKLLGQIYLYKFVLFLFFLVAGYETLSLTRIVKLIMPMWGFSNNFIGCFIVFWLTIPFLNILIHNMTKRQHELLLLLMLGMYSLLGSIPTFSIALNYVTWFGIIFIIASYIRLYPSPVFERKSLWGWLTLVCIVFATVSIVGIRLLGGEAGARYSSFFVQDSNKIFAVAIAFCSFLWFKNMKFRHSIVVNAFGAGTFGVLLIHANSEAMRIWLWKDCVDSVGHYALPLGCLILYSVCVVLVVFVVCNLIDQLRIATVEKWFFRWYDSKIANRADNWINNSLGNN